MRLRWSLMDGTLPEINQHPPLHGMANFTAWPTGLPSLMPKMLHETKMLHEIKMLHEML